MRKITKFRLYVARGFGTEEVMRHFLPISLVLIAAPALAQEFAPSPAYKECTTLASSKPAEALVKADEWLKVDDSYAAHHCRAMALYGLSRFAEAGDALGLVRDKIPAEQITLQTYVARQGAKAYVNAGSSDKAIGLLGAQINAMATGKYDNVTESKLSADLLLDRAKLRAKYGQAAQAVQDLDHAISLSPLNEEVLIERALAFEQLGDIPLAKQDAQAVLRLSPTHPQAVELMRRLRDK